MVSPEAADDRQEFSPSRSQVAKNDARLRFVLPAAICSDGLTCKPPKSDCPVSKVLNAEIKLDAKLI
jgi:hypothetical protein